MPIELRTQRDGRIRDTWYGRYEINVRRQYLNLDVKVAGIRLPPLSLQDDGDALFERSEQPPRPNSKASWKRRGRNGRLNASWKSCKLRRASRSSR